MSTIDLIIEEQDYLKANSYTFHLLTREWKKFNLPDSLNWQIHPFQEDQKALIPSNSGVYSFVIQPDIASQSILFIPNVCWYCTRESWLSWTNT